MEGEALPGHPRELGAAAETHPGNEEVFAEQREIIDEHPEKEKENAPTDEPPPPLPEPAPETAPEAPKEEDPPESPNRYSGIEDLTAELKDAEALAQEEIVKKTTPTTELELALTKILERKQALIDRITGEIAKMKNFVKKRKQTYKRKRKLDGAPTRALSAYNMFIKEYVPHFVPVLISIAS